MSRGYDPLRFKTMLAHRAHVRKTNPEGQLNQGSHLPGIRTSPYSSWNTAAFFAALASGGRSASEHCRSVAPIGTFSENHCVGVRSGTLKSHVQPDTSTSPQTTASDSVKILFAGDLMVSESGASIKLSTEFLATLEGVAFLVINIESPVNFEKNRRGRSGLNFCMTQSYLRDFVDQIKSANQDIKIVYNVANNHALDGNEPLNVTGNEKVLLKIDRNNFAILRTVKSIQEVDLDAIIIGAHFPEEEFHDLLPQCEFVTVLEKGGVRVGLIGFTDILNNNQQYWDRRVARTEDIPHDLKALKEQMGLDYLYLFGHGDIEQKPYQTVAWRELSCDLLARGADGFIGHGPHVPQTNEILRSGDQEKLIMHSIGNFFGPKRLQNTGLGLLPVICFSKSEVRFALHIVQAEVRDQNPVVGVIQGDEATTCYPALRERFHTLYPHQTYPVSNAPISEVLDTNKASYAPSA